MAGTLSFTGEPSVAAASAGSLPIADVSLPMTMKANLDLTVNQHAHNYMAVAGGTFSALPMGKVTAAKFVAIMTAGENPVQIKINGGTEILRIWGPFILQVPSANPITSIQVASAGSGASLEYLIVE